jgi:hypothetical protein
VAKGTGSEVAAADVQECVAQGTSATADSINWRLDLTGNSMAAPDFISAVMPSLGGMIARQCKRGYITFTIAAKSAPYRIEYSPFMAPSFYWNLTK